MVTPRAFAALITLTAAAFFAACLSRAQSGSAPADQLVKSYPGIISRIESNNVVFTDGSSLLWDDGKGLKSAADRLESADIEDMFAQPYPAGTAPAPRLDEDPGRARNEAFFLKVYGDCRSGEVSKALLPVAWLPRRSKQILKVSGRNGVAPQLKAVSDELDALPSSFDAYLNTQASAYNCRTIAGTGRLSGHAFGIAIDLAVKRTGYWRWAPRGMGKDHTRDVPAEIVAIFEKHGFIWGGKWWHFDTMHFEYRPELLPASQ